MFKGPVMGSLGYVPTACNKNLLWGGWAEPSSETHICRDFDAFGTAKLQLKAEIANLT